MKTAFLASAVLMAAIPGFAQFDAKNITITPENAKAGEAIEIAYDAANTPLAEDDSIKAVAYSLGADKTEQPKAIEVPLERLGRIWRGKLQVPVESDLLVFDFKNNHGKRDKNDGKGYALRLADNGEGELAMYRWAGLITTRTGIEYDQSELAKSVLKAFNQYPSLRKGNEFVYFSAFTTTTQDSTLILKEIQRLESQSDLSEDAYALLMYFFAQKQNLAKVNEWKEKAIGRLPEGTIAATNAFVTVDTAGSLSGRQKSWDEFKKKFAEDSVSLEGFETRYVNRVISDLVEEKKWQSLDSIAAIAKHAARVMSAYNSFAWDNAKKGTNLDTSALISKKSVEWAKAKIEEPVSDLDPPYYTHDELMENRKGTFTMYADTYAFILMQLGKLEEAKSFQKQAVDITTTDPEANERYLRLADTLGQGAEVVAFAEKIIPEGYGSPLVEEKFKKNYQNGDANARLAELNKAADEKLRTKYTELMINEPAPAFALKDLSGREVSLSELKGKVVILDFWATWCGPCIASMPGMQMAANKYKADPNVQFIFANTWQTEKNKNKVVTDFLAKKKYDFYVLMDDKDEVVKAYGVSGIPTKFIVDGKGNIRFKVVGIENTNPEAIEKEIDTLIDLAKKGK